LIFAFTCFMVMLPFFIALAILSDNPEPKAFQGQGEIWVNPISEIWHTSTVTNWILRFLFIAGLFIFPTAILAAAVIEDLPELFRFDRLIMPVFKAFVPYLVVVGLLALTCFIEINTRQKTPGSNEPMMHVAGKLAVNLAAQAVAIIAMRSIGLFYRHFGCYFRF
jgi:hypothetical protein